MDAKDMGTTGLINWIMEGKSYRSRGQRKRRAMEIVAGRYSDPERSRELFKQALAAAHVNKGHKEWALL